MEGTGRTIVSAGGTLNITGINNTLGRTLENAGTATYSGPNLSFGTSASSPGTLNNLAGGVFTVVCAAVFNWVGIISANAFNNAGTFIIQGAGTTTEFNRVALNNTGSVDVPGGTCTSSAAARRAGRSRRSPTARCLLAAAIPMTRPAVERRRDAHLQRARTRSRPASSIPRAR